MSSIVEQRMWRRSIAAVGAIAVITGAATVVSRRQAGVTPLEGCMCVDRPEAVAIAPDPEPQPMVEIHVKSVRGATVITGLRAQPLFEAPSDVDLARWAKLTVPAAEADTILGALVNDRRVAEAFIEPETELATTPEPLHATDGDSCPITTPSYEEHQGYISPAPGGIDAAAAWRRGLRGGGVWFADIEGAWNASHEDLPGARITPIGPQMTDGHWRAHGTAVLGEVVGSDNGKGVIGIAPDVERVFVSSIATTSTADAIDRAARQLRPGDVLLIELHRIGPRGKFIPVEYWDDVFDSIHAATQRGVVVIEAAGNGGEDLDNRRYDGKLSRSGRDSGAILVGAGAPPRAGFTDRERLDFSNYGSRLDVQGWGRKVATLDYGDLQSCDGGVDRHYTGEFGGTSSASPIVAGAAILVEDLARRDGAVLTPNHVRDLLRRTGTPQVRANQEPIGPRPDLARALHELDRTH